jgi:hypothetical protein
MAKKTTDAAKSLAAEATKKKAGTNKHTLKSSELIDKPKKRPKAKIKHRL